MRCRRCRRAWPSQRSSRSRGGRGHPQGQGAPSRAARAEVQGRAARSAEVRKCGTRRDHLPLLSQRCRPPDKDQFLIASEDATFVEALRLETLKQHASPPVATRIWASYSFSKGPYTSHWSLLRGSHRSTKAVRRVACHMNSCRGNMDLLRSADRPRSSTAAPHGRGAPRGARLARLRASHPG